MEGGGGRGKGGKVRKRGWKKEGEAKKGFGRWNGRRKKEMRMGF